MNKLYCSTFAISLLLSTSFLHSCLQSLALSGDKGDTSDTVASSADQSPEEALFKKWTDSKQQWADYSRQPKNRHERDKKGEEILAIERGAEADLKAAGGKAVPVLLAHLHEQDSSNFCQQTLAKIGEPAVLPCLEWLKSHPNDYDKLKNVFTSAGRPAGEKLVAMLQGGEDERSLAAQILSGKFLEKYYHSSHRRQETNLLSGTDQTVLTKAIMQESNETVKYELVEALRQFDMGNPDTTKIVVSLLEKDKSDTIRGAAIEVLGTWMQNASPAGGQEMTEALIKSLKADQSADVRQKAALALGSTKNVSTELITALRKAKEEDPVNVVRLSAMKTLGEMATTEQQCVSDIIDELKDPEGVFNGLVAVIKAGSKAKMAVPAILAANVPTRIDLKFRALEATQSDSPEIVKLLVQTLESPNTNRFFSGKDDAIRYLEKLGPKVGAPATDALRKLAGPAGKNNPLAINCLRSWGVDSN